MPTGTTQQPHADSPPFLSASAPISKVCRGLFIAGFLAPMEKHQINTLFQYFANLETVVGGLCVKGLTT
jgi:hypothetical protein